MMQMPSMMVPRDEDVRAMATTRTIQRLDEKKLSLKAVSIFDMTSE